ncbi:MAG: hypothetical protein NTV55_10790 [Planctomycetota bacterium]|nr:hypothetical protein [Planctomycetota bacterium]RLS38609.1 MAG: hypothetical protein DWH82_07540 [Planctomycetota bacterium]
MVCYWRKALSRASFAAFLMLAGCSSQSGGNAESPAPAASAAPQPGEDHGHRQSIHGGIIVPIGSDSYHAEAVFEKGGVLRLFILGKDESTVLEVEAQPLSAYAKTEGNTEAVSFVLRPAPQPGDKDGMTSQLLGHLPNELVGKRLEVTIPTVRIGGERFRVGFASTPPKEDMPVSNLSAEPEEKLFLTPGGIYTQADIKTNNNQTASRKFRGFQPSHDLKPKIGDRICPVTLTKANPDCAWVVGGKKYEFCCPPCVEEFVQLAKEKPGEIKEPSEYVKK